MNKHKNCRPRGFKGLKIQDNLECVSEKFVKKIVYIELVMFEMFWSIFFFYQLLFNFLLFIMLSINAHKSLKANRWYFKFL